MLDATLRFRLLQYERFPGLLHEANMLKPPAFNTILICVLAFSAMPTAVYSQSPQQKDKNADQNLVKLVEGLKTKFDRNKDGRISKAETPQQLKGMFGVVDLNKDGQLDTDELTRMSRLFSKQVQGFLTSKSRKPKIPDGVGYEENIGYRKGDSDAWKLDIAYPKKKSEKPYPAIIFVHGGGWRSGDKTNGMFRTIPIDYATKGYVCISINYRLTGEAPFPACVEDCKNAVRWLRANANKYNVDSDRIGAFGNSAGAHLVAMLGVVPAEAGLEGDGPHQEYSSRVQCVACAAAPTNFPKWYGKEVDYKAINGTLKMFFGSGTIDEYKELAKKASPITYVKPGTVPFFVCHGTADRTVPVYQGDSFVEALKEAKADVTYLRYDGAGHGAMNQNKKESFAELEKFFQRNLKK